MLAIGAWVPLYGITVHHNYGSLLALAFSCVGARVERMHGRPVIGRRTRRPYRSAQPDRLARGRRPGSASSGRNARRARPRRHGQAHPDNRAGGWRNQSERRSTDHRTIPRRRSGRGRRSYRNQRQSRPVASPPSPCAARRCCGTWLPFRAVMRLPSPVRRHPFVVSSSATGAPAARATASTIASRSVTSSPSTRAARGTRNRVWS